MAANVRESRPFGRRETSAFSRHKILNRTRSRLSQQKRAFRPVPGQPRPNHVKQGLVISDLHLLSHRSRAEELLEGIREEIARVDLLVLNGDTFDFNWSSLPSTTESVGAAIDWLDKLAGDFENCEVHYLFGNHDCLDYFLRALEFLALEHPHFHCHDQRFVIGRALFLHGDCANRRMDGPALERMCNAWSRDRPRTRLHSRLYGIIDAAGLSRRFHELYFPRPSTVKRIAHHLDHVFPGWRDEVDDVYFGHTHQPFRDHEFEGVRFHNTGSAFHEMGFQPLTFSIA